MHLEHAHLLRRRLDGGSTARPPRRPNRQMNHLHSHTTTTNHQLSMLLPPPSYTGGGGVPYHVAGQGRGGGSGERRRAVGVRGRGEIKHHIRSQLHLVLYSTKHPPHASSLSVPLQSKPLMRARCRRPGTYQCRPNAPPGAQWAPWARAVASAFYRSHHHHTPPPSSNSPSIVASPDQCSSARRRNWGSRVPQTGLGRKLGRHLVLTLKRQQLWRVGLHHAHRHPPMSAPAAGSPQTSLWSAPVR